MENLELIYDVKSTKSLYGVSPLYFVKFNSYIEILKEKEKLAKDRIRNLMIDLDFVEDYDERIKIQEQIKECQKAVIFNRKLIKEYKDEVKNLRKDKQ